MKIFGNDTLRAIDKLTIENEGVTSLELIERAAEAITNEIMLRWRPNKKVSVFAGPGNNGADALVVSRMLIEQGFTPEIYLFNIKAKHINSECAQSRDRLIEMGYPNIVEVVDNFRLPELTPDHLVIDGLFGSGLKKSLIGGFISLVRYINESQATIVSIDVPSGLYGDWNPSSVNRDIIHANLTLTFQLPRLAFLFKENAELVGEWKILDIGLSADAIRKAPTDFYFVEKSDIRQVILRRDPFASKADYGSGLIIAGSYGMMGAAVLCAKGALRSGAGKITVHSPRCGYNVMQSSVPEVLFDADSHDIVLKDIVPSRNYNAIAVGPGIGVNEATVTTLEEFLKRSQSPVILDADALNCIAKRPALLNYIPTDSILTPHAAEFDRIFGPHVNDESRLQKAIEKARKYGIIIVLKGRYTAIVRRDGRVYFNSSGNAALATAGSGDVLTGLMLGFMTQGYAPEIASLISVYVHGVAGELASEEHGIHGVTAGDVAQNVGRAIKQILTV